MEIKTNKYFIFGSYLKKTDYNDIDILIVVCDISKIQSANIFLDELSCKYPQNNIHVHIYTENEYMNKENKFSYTIVTHEITEKNFIKLYKKHSIDKVRARLRRPGSGGIYLVMGKQRRITAG